MSGLDDLTREELVEMVLNLHATSVAQEKQIVELRALVQGQAERISELEEEVAKLRGSRPGGISIKPSVKKKDKEPRKGRTQWFSRKKQPATKVICHAAEECPDCGRGLAGGSIKWSHQVVDIPPVRAEIVDHLFIERYCGVCGKRWTPDPKEVLSGVVVGKKSFGINLMSLVAHLKTVCRVPIEQIRKLLKALFGVKISSGELAELLHDVAETGEAEYDRLLGQVRGSPVVNADETSWREDGVNGYLWSFSTPTIRYYMYRKSRGSIIVTEALSEEFEGTLVTDFYAAYNVYLGEKQRCWVHFGRDLESLKEKNPDVPEVGVWVDAVMAVYHRAKATLTVDYSNRERSRLRRRFQGEVLKLARPYAQDYTVPQRILAKRIVNFISELFVFVQYPSVPSGNNAAERAIRPAVVARKISGGTRSEKGSKTMSVLRSVFETWNAQGRNTIDACHEMLIDHNQQMLSPAN